MGSFVRQVNAYDYDTNSRLTYAIQEDSYAARDQYNRDVVSSAHYNFRVLQPYYLYLACASDVKLATVYVYIYGKLLISEDSFLTS